VQSQRLLLKIDHKLPKYNRAERKNATPVKRTSRCRQFAQRILSSIAQIAAGLSIHKLHPSLSCDAIRQRAKPFFPGRALFARGRRLGALAED
jgi:hypothetical protein